MIVLKKDVITELSQRYENWVGAKLEDVKSESGSEVGEKKTDSYSEKIQSRWKKTDSYSVKKRPTLIPNQTHCHPWLWGLNKFTHARSSIVHRFWELRIRWLKKVVSQCPLLTANWACLHSSSIEGTKSTLWCPYGGSVYLKSSAVFIYNLELWIRIPCSTSYSHITCLTLGSVISHFNFT